MAGKLHAMRSAARPKRAPWSPPGRLAALCVLAVASACTTGDVFELKPAVDVGSTTAALPKASGLQSLVPSNPYMTAAYPRMEEPMSPVEQLSAE